MGLKDMLSKMKLVELDPAEASAAGGLPGGGPLSGPPERASAPGRSPLSGGPGAPPPSLDELLGRLPDPPKIDEQKLAQAAEAAEGAGGDEIPDFAAVYKAAGVADPAHGYTAYKVLDIFASPGFATLDVRAKAAALTGFLNMNPTGPVPITDVVQDAVKRDQALDRFEEFLRGKLNSRAAEIEKENAALQKELDELARRNREKIEANRIALEAEQAKLTRWQVAKRAEERKLFDAVNPFVEANPITTADSPKPAAAPSPAAPAPAAAPEQ